MDAARSTLAHVAATEWETRVVLETDALAADARQALAWQALEWGDDGAGDAGADDDDDDGDWARFNDKSSNVFAEF